MKPRATGRRADATVADSDAREPAPTLPAWKAFVVQFSDTAGRCSGVFAGRIEHLNTGRRVRFESRSALLTTLEHMLDEVEDREAILLEQSRRNDR